MAIGDEPQQARAKPSGHTLLAHSRFKPKNGIPVFAALPAKDTITDGQRVYVRKDGMDILYRYAADVDEFERQQSDD